MPPVKVEEALARTGVELGRMIGSHFLGRDSVSGRVAFEDSPGDHGERLTVQYKIDPKVSYINDPNLDKGKQRTVQKEEPGVLERKYTVVYEDGEEIREPKPERVSNLRSSRSLPRGTRPVVKTMTVARE